MVGLQQFALIIVIVALGMFPTHAEGTSIEAVARERGACSQQFKPLALSSLRSILTLFDGTIRCTLRLA